MEMLLLILKIIGSVLLVLLLLFLAMILSVVFIPVRYRIKGSAASPDKIEANLVIGWMFHLLHGRIQISGKDIFYKIRILGIPIPLGTQKKPRMGRKRRKRHSASEDKMKDHLKNPEETKVTETKTNGLIEAEGLKKEEKEPENEPKSQSAEKNPSQAEIPASQKNTQKQRKKHSIRQIWETCNAWLMHLKQIAVGLKNKTITWKEAFFNIKNIISEETNKNAVIGLFREFRYLLKHFSPRKAAGTLQYGTQDPAITGQILGIISLFPFWYRYQISVQPDFTAEDFYARGSLTLNGRVRALHLLRTGIRLIKDKNIRRLINQFRK